MGLLDGKADAGTGEAPATGRAWPIGKVWDGGAAFAEPADALAYAAATADDSPAYLGPEPICPPMFHVRLFKPLLFAIATDPELELDMLRLVHGEHDATFHRPLRPWDLVSLRARLERVEEKASGRVVASRLYAFVEGELAVEARTVYFIRAPRPAGAAPEQAAARPAAATPPAPPPPELVAVAHVAPDQSLRYAAASLDDNPIHIDPAVAAAAGLPGVILQGLCTMAMTGATVVRGAAGNDARRLRRLAVRFARPVRNGATLTVHGWSGPGGRWSVETRDDAGHLVLSHAIAELG